ncbi:MAG: hypothetical protein ACXAEL_13140 [Candidatus Hodarchaeales archaeon]|jgi:hypothetical protein
MKIKDKLRKNRSIVAIGAFSIIALVVISSSIFLLPDLELFSSSETPEPGPIKGSALGTRIANFMDFRTPDVVFAWSSNNTVVNSDLTEQFNDYVHAVMNYGMPISAARSNVSVFIGLENFRMETVENDPEALNSVAENFENALNGLEDVSASLKSLDDVLPVAFLWDIAYSDNTSLSLIYSQEYHVIAAINGTWIMGEIDLLGKTVPFPYFQYDANHYDSVNFLELDRTTETPVTAAIQAYIDMTVGAFE